MLVKIGYLIFQHIPRGFEPYHSKASAQTGPYPFIYTVLMGKHPAPTSWFDRFFRMKIIVPFNNLKCWLLDF